MVNVSLNVKALPYTVRGSMTQKVSISAIHSTELTRKASGDTLLHVEQDGRCNSKDIYQYQQRLYLFPANEMISQRLYHQPFIVTERNLHSKGRRYVMVLC